MGKNVWATFDANGQQVDRGKDEKYTGNLPSKNEYRNRQEAGNASHSQGGQGVNIQGAGQGTGSAYYTGPLQGGRYNIHSADGKVINTVRERPTNLPTKAQYNNQGGEGVNIQGAGQGRRFIAVPYTGPHKKTSNDHVIKDRQNPYYKSKVYPNKESAESGANSMEEMPSAFPTASNTDPPANKNPANSQGGDDSGTAPVSQQSSNDNTLKTTIDREKERLTGTGEDDYKQYIRRKNQKNDNTDFTRLLKNAGLLKEFY